MIGLTTIPFDCPRTCPDHGDRWCRFRPLLDRLGPVRVNSHTAKIRVEFNDPDSLRWLVEKMGGLWLGHGRHELCETKEDGYGFRLPFVNGWNAKGWKARPGENAYWAMPCVVRDDGTLAYDVYDGSWGDVRQLETMKVDYAYALTEQRAAALGWLCERTDQGLLVHHPDGGTLTLSSTGEVATTGFNGGGCHAAREALG